MAFKKIEVAENEPIRIEPGIEVEGWFMGAKNIGQSGSKQYLFKQPDGSVKKVWGIFALDNVFLNDMGGMKSGYMRKYIKVVGGDRNPIEGTDRERQEVEVFVDDEKKLK